MVIWSNNIFVLWILLLCNLLYAFKIENLVVPDLIQVGNVSDIVLDCQFSEVTAGEGFTVRWFYNGSKLPVYQWRPGTSPLVSGILDGRLDPSFRISSSKYDQGRAIRIIRLGPELTGEYSCSIEHNRTEVRQTKAMLIFSPEQEFDLKIEQKSQNVFEVKCVVRGVFPLPLVLLEYKNEGIPKQQQRVWRNSGGGSETALYAAESAARVAAAGAGARVACRLLLPEAGYSARKEATLPSSHQCRSHAAARQISAGIFGFLALFNISTGNHFFSKLT